MFSPVGLPVPYFPRMFYINVAPFVNNYSRFINHSIKNF
nr:MAG TPA: hypothetical protein [Caudoviricetes sp.]